FRSIWSSRRASVFSSVRKEGCIGAQENRSLLIMQSPSTRSAAPVLHDRRWRLSRGIAAGAEGRDLHDVFGVVINEVQPVLGDVRGREDIVLAVFGFEGNEQVVLADAFILAAGE